MEELVACKKAVAKVISGAPNVQSCVFIPHSILKYFCLKYSIYLLFANMYFTTVSRRQNILCSFSAKDFRDILRYFHVVSSWLLGLIK